MKTTKNVVLLLAGAVMVHAGLTACGGGESTAGAAGGSGAGGNATAAPKVVTVACASVGGTRYAVQGFPGEPKERLARVSAIANYPAGTDKDGYDSIQVLANVKDGEVRVPCGSADPGLISIESVTFAYP